MGLSKTVWRKVATVEERIVAVYATEQVAAALATTYCGFASGCYSYIMIYSLGDRRIETCGEEFFVAPTASVIGTVRIGRWASVWFSAVLRGDNDWIDIGDGSNVQDGSILHTDSGTPLRIGKDVTIGHAVLLHACQIGDRSLVANRSMVLDGASVG